MKKKNNEFAIQFFWVTFIFLFVEKWKTFNTGSTFFLHCKIKLISQPVFDEMFFFFQGKRMLVKKKFSRIFFLRNFFFSKTRKKGISLHKKGLFNSFWKFTKSIFLTHFFRDPNWRQFDRSINSDSRTKFNFAKKTIF